MNKGEVYKYIYDTLNKGKGNDLNYEWELQQFSNKYSNIPKVNGIIEQICQHHYSIDSVEYFAKIITQGGIDYDVAVKKFVSEHTRAEEIYGKKEINKQFILCFLLYAAKLDLKTEEIEPLMKEIIKRGDLVNTLYHCLNKVMGIFNFEKPAQLHTLLQSCRQPHLN